MNKLILHIEMFHKKITTRIKESAIKDKKTHAIVFWSSFFCSVFLLLSFFFLKSGTSRRADLFLRNQSRFLDHVNKLILRIEMFHKKGFFTKMSLEISWLKMYCIILNLKSIANTGTELTTSNRIHIKKYRTYDH